MLWVSPKSGTKGRALRFKVTLVPDKGAIRLPYNYNYLLASTIYSFLGMSDPHFSEFLHDEGYHGGGKDFKLFTFSQLLTSQRKALSEEIILRGKIEWFISSPKEDFLSHLVEGILGTGYLSLSGERLMVEQVEVLAQCRTATVPSSPLF